MAYTISIFTGNQTNINPDIIKNVGDFSELSRFFKTCRKGSKHDGYFVRGQVDGSRSDSNLSCSRILVLDGDAGKGGGNAPSPRSVHVAFKELGFSHIIYTTHSHSKEKNKFRCVVPTNREYEKEHLEYNINSLIKLLEENNLGIDNVREMYTWSQPWFFPTRDDPGDGLFEYYEYFNGKPYDIKKIVCEDTKNTKNTYYTDSGYSGGSEHTLSGFIAALDAGEGVHNVILNMSKQYMHCGMEKAANYFTTAMLIKGSGLYNVRAERYAELIGEDGSATDELKRIIDGAYEDEEEDFEIELDWECEKADLPPEMPGGLLGQFIKETEEFMMYKDPTIAWVSSMFILASIAGRKFNVDIHNSDGMAAPTALNLYLTLAAETGAGKSEIENAVENCYLHFSGNDGAIQDFFYKGRLSGPRALYGKYADQRCLGIISNEKGVSDQSKMGDVQGMKDAWLNLYGQGAWKKWTGAGAFSDKDTNIKNVKAVAISRIGESTPVELKKAYTQDDQVANGLIPRESIFVIKDLVTEVNRDIRINYSPEIVSKMHSLIEACHADCKKDVFKPYIITVDDKKLLDDMVKAQEEYRNKQNSGDSMHERAMASRMFVKILRYCGLITVFNKDRGHENALVIEREDWLWAKRIVEYEFKCIENIVGLTVANDTVGDAIKDIAKGISDMLKGKCGNKDGVIDEKHRRTKIIPRGKLRKITKGSSAIKELEGNPAYSNSVKTGFDKAIDYMEKQGYLKQIDKNPLPLVARRGKVLKILEDINDIF